MSKVIISGGRNFTNKDFIFKKLDKIKHIITLLINGDARGVDKLSTEWAIINKVPYKLYPADWKTHSLSAGPIRNELMLLEKPEYVVIFPGGNGTNHMKKIAKREKIKIIEFQEDIFDILY